MKKEDEQPKIERRGPFYAPRKLTEKEIEARNRKRAMEKIKLEEILEEKDYDGKTKLIARIIGRVNFSMAKLYLWRFQLFNAMTIEITGVLMWKAIENLFSMITYPAIATVLGLSIGFLLKFVLYSAWIFKRVQK